MEGDAWLTAAVRSAVVSVEAEAEAVDKAVDL